MEDSFEKLADIIKENNLCGHALDYLADIKREWSQGLNYGTPQI